jgi:hypothetical protein
MLQAPLRLSTRVSKLAGTGVLACLCALAFASPANAALNAAGVGEAAVQTADGAATQVATSAESATTQVATPTESIATRTPAAASVPAAPSTQPTEPDAETSAASQVTRAAQTAVSTVAPAARVTSAPRVVAPLAEAAGVVTRTTSTVAKLAGSAVEGTLSTTSKTASQATAAVPGKSIIGERTTRAAGAPESAKHAGAPLSPSPATPSPATGSAPRHLASVAPSTVGNIAPRKASSESRSDAHAPTGIVSTGRRSGPVGVASSFDARKWAASSMFLSPLALGGAGARRAESDLAPAAPGPRQAPPPAPGSVGGVPGGTGAAIFFILAGLLALADPLTTRRLRLASEPQPTAPLVLIPERPG